MDGTEDLKDLLTYMHVEDDDPQELSLIRKLWAASVRQLTKNGIPVTSEEGWLAAAGLTLQAYDGTPLQPGIRQIINGCKLDDPIF